MTVVDPFVSVPLSALCDSEVPGDVPRDQHKRPLILQPDDTLEPYTRISTASGWLGDSGHGLGIWNTRHACLSLAREVNKDLRHKIAALEYSSERGGNRKLDETIAEACDRSVAMCEARNWGTAVHSFTDLPAEHPIREHVPEEMLADVRSYDQAMTDAGLVLIESEVFVVNDAMKVAGTLDGLYVDVSTGLAVVGDKKTTPNLKEVDVTAQLGMYHGGMRYDPVTGVRTPLSMRLDPHQLLAIQIIKERGATKLWRIKVSEAQETAREALRAGRRRAGKKSLVSAW